MRRFKCVSKGILAVCLSMAIGASAAFAAYPTKPITVTQGFKAGGGSDTVAQLTQPYLEKVVGQSFINQYIPGATGAIAWTQLAKTAKKDGYTLSITNTPMLQTNYIMNKEIKYTIAELEPIANVVTDPGIIVVSKDSKYKTVQDLLEAMKQNPGKITVGNSGVGGDDFFTTLLFEKVTGLKVQMIPFEGDGPSWQAAMGGKIDVSFKSDKGEILVCENGAGVDFSEEKAKEILLEKEIQILVGLNDGPYTATAWGCDLTYDYVSAQGHSRGCKGDAYQRLQENR